ncbi:MAG: helix-turn-helix domain-containing protein [Candidatus Aenigmarchaeota archaeon]|nr:helix-turn-helix domain-containing protein [Candidatus Aenigmarchaeota archaeon]
MGEYLTVKQLGEMIGRSPSAVRNLCLRRRVPYRKVAGRLIFVRQEIEDWIDSAPGVRREHLDKEG